MRGQSLESLIEYEAKQRPEVKVLLDRVADLTDEEIEGAVVPLPWYKQALYQIRGKRVAEREAARMAALVEVGAILGTVPDPMGFIAVYNGETCFMQVSHSSSIEVKTGMIVWYPLDGGGVWIDSVFAKIIPKQLFNIPKEGVATKLAYKARLRERLLKL